MRAPKKLRLPTEVLERARKVSTAPRPPPPPNVVAVAPRPREKIVAALKKLHPMD